METFVRRAVLRFNQRDDPTVAQVVADVDETLFAATEQNDKQSVNRVLFPTETSIENKFS